MDRARADFARFFNASNHQGFDQYALLTGRTESQAVAALATDFVDPSLVSETPWGALLSEILSGSFLRSCDPELGTGSISAPLHLFLNWADRQLSAWGELYPADWPALRKVLLQQLSELLAGLAYKTFILEANILALKQGGATATGPIAQAFARSVRSSPRFLQRLYLTYPGLSRLLAEAVLQWRRNTEELLSRLARDFDELARTLLGAECGPLQRITGSLSDPHDGGRCVQILEFGGGHRLVYKPRPVAVDAAFESLLLWLNQAGLEPAMRPPRTFEREGYGWIEFIAHDPLPSLEAAHDFYRRHGINLALVYVTRATDFHSENIIAAGDQPVLVDLETLMHGVGQYKVAGTAQTPAEKALADSSFMSGLLPGWGKGAQPAPDLSGIGSQEGQVYRDKSDVVRWGEDGSVRVVRERVQVRENDNRPIWNGARLNPAHYREDILDGFESAYRLLMSRRSELVAPDGPLERFRSCVVRHVPLSTLSYSSLLRRGLHPDFARRSVHRELIFAILAHRSIALPGAKALLPSEVAALTGGDIPKFTTRPDTRSLFDESGREIPEFLQEETWTEVLRRVGSLSEANLLFQRKVIGLAMSTLVKLGEPGSEMQPTRPPPSATAQVEELVDEVRSIGHALCAQAIVAEGAHDWLTLCQTEDGGSAVSAAGADLYDGVAGIGLFLGYAGRRLEDGRLLDAARQCATLAVAGLGRSFDAPGGGFSGRASTAYGLLHLSALFDEKEWLRAATDSLVQFADKAENDLVLDIIAGSAGLCGVLAAAHQLTGDPKLLAAALKPAQHLVARRVPCPTGFAWPGRNSHAPLTGFAHGAAGMGWALIRVGQLAGHSDLIEAGHAAFDYETSVYSAELRGWPDLRKLHDDTRDGNAWCHGSPGIGLCRATLPPGCMRASEALDLRRFIDRQRSAHLAPTDSLCHGELGNIDGLIEAAAVLDAPELLQLARQRASGALWRRRETGAWRCGTVQNVFVPGLMLGLAGIGYGLLRVAFPDEIPSLLSLSPPAALKG